MTLSSQIAEDLEESIRIGKYQPNDRIPSISETGKHYGVSHVTVLRAYRELEAKNLIISRKGLGNFVKPFQSSAVRTGRIGVFTRPQRVMNKLDNYFNCINIGIENAASEFRLDILRSHKSAVFNQYDPVPGLLEQVADEIVKTQTLVDGFILDERFSDEQLSSLLPRLSKPVIMINRPTRLPVCSVSNDNAFALNNIIDCAKTTECSATLFIAFNEQNSLDPQLPFDRFSCVLREADRIPELHIVENTRKKNQKEISQELSTVTATLLKKHQKILILAETEYNLLLFKEAVPEYRKGNILLAGMQGLNLHDSSCYQERFCNSIPDSYAIGKKAVSLLAASPAQPERFFVKPQLYLGSISHINIFDGGNI